MNEYAIVNIYVANKGRIDGTDCGQTGGVGGEALRVRKARFENAISHNLHVYQSSLPMRHRYCACQEDRAAYPSIKLYDASQTRATS